MHMSTSVAQNVNKCILIHDQWFFFFFFLARRIYKDKEQRALRDAFVRELQIESWERAQEKFPMTCAKIEDMPGSTIAS